MDFFDTIAAVSTPYGVGGVALIRISGDEAIKFASKVCSRPLFVVDSGSAEYRKIVSPDGHVIDDAIVTVFRAPRSFTGEDTVEISCHGGIKVTEEVLHAVIAAGARPAEAGEFTRRAFLSGKISLERAEAIGSLLYAKTSEQVKLFSGGAADALGERARAIYGDIATLIADMYARIDFPEEDLGSIGDDEIIKRLTDIESELSSLLDTYRCGHAISEGIKTVICGRTNAGKSSLYNRLVGRDAAIVTDIEGTTRDTLEDTIPLGRLTLRLSDTAGLRESDDAVEKIGIGRAKEKIAEAELVIALFDGTKKISPEDEMLLREITEMGKEGSCVFVINKCDADVKTDRARLRSLGEVVEISAKTGAGIDELIRKIEKRYIDAECDITRDALIINERQFYAVKGALDALVLAKNSMLLSMTQDVCSIDLESAMSCLSELGGNSVSEDVVARIFSKFCVGK